MIDIFMTREMIEDCLWYKFNQDKSRACASVYRDSATVAAYKTFGPTPYKFILLGSILRENIDRWFSGEDVEMFN